MAINLSSFLISSFITFFVIVLPTIAQQKGFTTNLIHRDSPLSRLNTPSLNHYDRVRKSIQRSMSKLNRFKTSESGDIETDVRSAKGEYLMELSIGTPPVTQLGIVDTGSDLIWTQCQPCLKCYNQTLPIFNPRKSSTYNIQSCDSQACRDLDSRQFSCTRRKTCSYLYQYGDRSHTIGDLSTETITFKSVDNPKGVSFPKVTFGCGHDNDGTFRDDGSGLVGLGNGPLSLVSQLGSSIGGKFSYCLIPFDKEGNYTSKLYFGTDGEVSGRGVISTPIVKGNPETFYFLTLEGITVGDSSKIPFYKKSSTESDYGPPSTNEGNIIIDSGTTLTMLPQEMYSDFNTALVNAISAQQIDDPSGQLQLCYQTKDGGADLAIPDITLNFDGGDLVLKPSNTFVQVADGVVCLAMVPSDSELGSILGNVAQMDFLVGYDTEEMKVSFKPMDCTKEQN